MTETPQYQWPTWWGTAARSDAPPQIHAKLLEIRRAIGGLKAQKGTGAAFPVKSAKDLVIRMRAAIDAAECHVWVVAQEVRQIEVEKGTACLVQSKVRVGAPDGSYLDFTGSGHGVDPQDKAAGKASTYSYKDALVKGLSLPDAEMVDTDDTDTPIEGGPRRGKRAAPKVAGPDLVAEALGKVAEAKSKAELTALITELRATLPPEAAAKVGPAAMKRMGELE